MCVQLDGFSHRRRQPVETPVDVEAEVVDEQLEPAVS